MKMEFFKNANKDKMVYAIILTGGKGERLWPLSRYYRPKQLLKVASDKTLLQQTMDRIRPKVSASNIYVVTNSVLFELIRKQLAGFKVRQDFSFKRRLPKEERIRKK